MPAEITFVAATLDGEENAERPRLVCSVAQAFDMIDSLPPQRRRLPRWRKTRRTLRRLQDRPQDTDLARAAGAEFYAGLLAEGWFGKPDADRCRASEKQ